MYIPKLALGTQNDSPNLNLLKGDSYEPYTSFTTDACCS